MKILYVGHIDEGGTCRDRMLSLERIGNEVVGFDVARFQPRNRLMRSAQWRWHPTFLLGDLNRSLIDAAISVGHLNCLWVDKGVWIFPETLLAVKAKTDCRLVHYTPDSQILVNRSSHFLDSIPIYDLLFDDQVVRSRRIRTIGRTTYRTRTPELLPRPIRESHAAFRVRTRHWFHQRFQAPLRTCHHAAQLVDFRYRSLGAEMAESCMDGASARLRGEG